ncbi:hypothetical protein A0256_15485 [Mucilaginibacter sp. PAMC 26640]|nr:hypothetical protein A0256_15485 [Mucilaginibacter sp. PAMC 26640]
MSRPQLPKEQKRSIKITFRLAEKEKIKIEEAAKVCGLPVGIFIREKLLKSKFPEPKVAKVDLQTYQELKKIGVNVNQLARHANAGRLPTGILAILMKLIQQENKIINLLLYDRESENR